MKALKNINWVKIALGTVVGLYVGYAIIEAVKNLA